MTCCKDISAGKLNRQIKILRRTDAPDGMGGVTETWSTQATVWAKVRAVSSRERAYAGRIEEQVDFKMTVRFVGDVNNNPAYTPDDRIEYQGLTYGIVGVVDVESARQWLEISVRAAQ